MFQRTILFRPFLFLLVISSLFLSACEKDKDEPIPESGGLFGKVSIENKYGQPLYNDRGDVDVHLSMNFYTDYINTTTDGSFQFHGLTAGTYYLRFEKEGYSKRMRTVEYSLLSPQYPVENNSQKLSATVLTKDQNVNFNSINAELYEEGILISANFSPAPPQPGLFQGYRIFMGDTEEVSPNHFLIQKFGITNSGEVNATFPLAQLNGLGFEEGDGIYFVVFADYRYDDTYMEGDSLRFPHLSTQNSGVVSVNLP